MANYKSSVLLISVALGCGFAAADTDQAQEERIERIQADTELQLIEAQAKEEQRQAKKANTPDLSGFGFGAAVNYTFEDEVESAFVDESGLIRTTEASRAEAGFVLEAHFLLKQDKILPFSIPGFGGFTSACESSELICGSGPFISLETGGSNEFIEEIGFGYMWGFRHTETGNVLGGLGQWNFGVGVSIDPEVQRLAQGFEQGMPLPTGETEIRFENDADAKLLFIVTIGAGGD